MNKTKFFLHKVFCLLVVAEMFLEKTLFPEIFLVLKNPGQPTRLADRGNFCTFTLSMISYSQISLIY